MTDLTTSSGCYKTAAQIRAAAERLRSVRHLNTVDFDMARRAVANPEAFLARPSWQRDLRGALRSYRVAP